MPKLLRSVVVPVLHMPPNISQTLCCRADEALQGVLLPDQRSYVFADTGLASAHYAVWLLADIQVSNSCDIGSTTALNIC